MKEFKCYACGICETDCEYHRPGLEKRHGVISEETIGDNTISGESLMSILKQRYSQDAIGAYYFSVSAVGTTYKVPVYG